jgi:hypothetical protein
MKVISLLQPWASLVVIGAKRIETRSWNTKYRGPLLIHASKKEFKPVKGMESLMANMLQAGFFDQVEHIPYGAIICSVNLIDTAGVEEINRPPFYLGAFIHGNYLQLNEAELSFGDYSPNRYGWLLSDPVQFAKPIPAKGQLNLWDFDLFAQLKL